MSQGSTALAGRRNSDLNRLFAISLAVAAFVMCMFAVSAISDDYDADPVVVTGITIDQSSKTLELGVEESKKTVVLTVTITPNNATDKTVDWVSSNTAIATVSAASSTAEEVGGALKATITVTAVKAGTATITATAHGTTHTATCAITVEQHPTGLTLNKTSMALKVNGSETLTATVAPTTVTDKYKTVAWYSSDDSVATVSNGKVTGVGAGNATITAVTVDNGKTATCTVTVTTQAVTSITINNVPTSPMIIGAKTTLTATVLPADATNKDVTWTSSNSSVASVNSTTGEVTAVSYGEVTITARSVSTPSVAKTCTISVAKIPVTSVSIAKSNYDGEVGDSITIEYTVLPADATFPACTFTSSNTNVASINAQGVVTALAPGSTTITVTNTDSGLSATCTVAISDVKTIVADVVEAEGKATLQNEDAIKNAVVNAFNAHLKPLVIITLTDADYVSMTPSLVRTTSNYLNSEMIIEFPTGTVTFSQRALAKINTSTETVSFQMKEVEIPEPYAELNISKVFDLTVFYGAKATEVNYGTGVTVSIPYVLQAGEDAKDLMVVYLPDSGRAKKVVYGEPDYPVYTDGSVVFMTDHFSKYAFFFHDADVGVGDFNILVMGGFLAVIICLSIFILFYLRRYDIEDTLEGYYDDGQQGL